MYELVELCNMSDKGDDIIGGDAEIGFIMVITEINIVSSSGPWLSV